MYFSTIAPSQFWVLTSVSAGMIGFALAVYTYSNAEYARTNGSSYVTLSEAEEPPYVGGERACV